MFMAIIRVSIRFRAIIQVTIKFRAIILVSIRFRTFSDLLYTELAAPNLATGMRALNLMDKLRSVVKADVFEPTKFVNCGQHIIAFH